MRCKGPLLLVLLALAIAVPSGGGRAGPSSPAATGSSGWRQALPGYPWSFPRDHWAHPAYRTEWWYLTGTLVSTDDPGRRFGYQLTFFRVGLLPQVPPFDSAWASRGLVVVHAAVTDVSRREHRFTDAVRREIPLLGGFPASGDSLLAWCVAPAGTDDGWRLSWNGDGFSFHARDDRAGLGFTFDTHAAKPLVLEGPGGVSRKGGSSDAASLYYSFTRLATRGTLQLGGETVSVTGESWMDKEFGSNQLAADQAGWDWFSLRLDDGRDLMIYLLRDRDGRIDEAHGTLVAPDGTPSYLGPRAWKIDVESYWTSPATGARYPASWTLELPDADLRGRIRPLIADQENVPRRTPTPPYWEGAVEIRGDDGRRLGEGYVELTGYAPGARPAL